MNNKGRGKEIKLNVANNFNVIAGTVDNKHPKAIYLKLSAWAEPTSDDETINYTSVIRKINKKVKSHSYNTLPQEFFNHNRTIVDLDIRESGIAYNKRSFMSCEITLFQNTEYSVNDEKMIAELKKISSSIISEIFNNSEYFKFHKTKK